MKDYQINKIILSFLAFFLLLSFYSYGQSNVTESKLYKNLNGKVKTVVERRYDIMDLEKGFTDGNLCYYGFYYRIDYDKDGRTIEEVHFSQDGLSARVVPVRNRKKKLTGQMIYDANGEVYTKVKIVYASKDKLQLEFYDTDHIKLFSLTIRKEGKVQKEIGKRYGYRKKGNYKNKHDRYYVIGNQIEISEYDDNGNMITTEIIISTTDDVLEQEEDFEDKAETVHVDEDDETKGEVQKYYYEYPEFDNQNNWVRRLAYSSGMPSYMVIREIEYY